MKILKGKSLWLRNAGVMNDYSEIEHGRAVVKAVITNPSELSVRFFAILDAIQPELSRQVMERHADHHKHARETVFMASFSEHDPADQLGRLSMWRAYGGPVAGVALLFHGGIANLELEIDLNVNASPVFYGGPNEFVREFADMVAELEADLEFLKASDPDLILNAATSALQFSMYSIKHQGFAEEREWRAIHRPFEYSSEHVVPETYSIGGIPQAVYQLPFHNPDKGPLFNIPQLHLPDILAGILIGPCAYPETVLRAFVDQLAEIGIENPRERIIVSNIPLRQQW